MSHCSKFKPKYAYDTTEKDQKIYDEWIVFCTRFEKSQNSNLMPLNDRSTCNWNIFDIFTAF